MFKKQSNKKMESTMKFLRYLLPVVAVAFGFTASADELSREQARQRDYEAITDFIKTKRAITVQEKGGNLMVSGDVRFEYAHINEKHGGQKYRGRGSGSETSQDVSAVVAPNPTNDFDVEFNLMLDYKADRTWATVQLQYDNGAGVDKEDSSVTVERNGVSTTYSNVAGCGGSGTYDHLNLRKAFFGYNILEQGTSRLDIEIGRRSLYHVFDSKVQFQSRFDGILLNYSNSFEGITDFYAKVAAFVVDENVNHLGYVGELGFMNIMDYGIDFKYSYIHWHKEGLNRWHQENAIGYRYNTSQFTVNYNFHPEILKAKAKLYGAFLINHQAAGDAFYTEHGKKRIGWYAGFSVGEIKKQGDWSVDLNYQYVEAQAVNSSDVSGIGRGNVYGIPFIPGTANGEVGGNANYKGWRLEGLYAITDNLTLDVKWERSRACHNSIGDSHRYNKFEVEAIYAF